jgi:hypothetical protein
MKRDNKGIGVVEIILIVVVAGLIFTLLFSHKAHAETIEKTQTLKKMKFSCYCPESCPGKVTASGEHVREGIIASSQDHLGDCALIYLSDGTFLGFYECLDTGGSRGIKNGYVIDCWTPNLSKAKHLMKITEGVVYVEWIENPAG